MVFLLDTGKPKMLQWHSKNPANFSNVAAEVYKQIIMTPGAQQNEMLEKMKITELILRYFAAIDDKCLSLELAKNTFATTGKIIRPDDLEINGPEQILAAHQKSFARFKATHHVITNLIVGLDGATAVLRSNVIANHVWAHSESNPALNNKNFLADGVMTAKAIKVNDQWRISELKNRVIWREGDGMKEILNFGR